MALEQQYKSIFTSRDVANMTADPKNSGINVVDRLTGDLFRVSSKLVIEQLYNTVEIDIGIGKMVSYRFEERTYERMAGLNLLVQHLGTKPHDMEAWVQQFCTFIYSALWTHCGPQESLLFIARSGALMNISVPDARLTYADRYQFVERLQASLKGLSVRCTPYNPIASITKCFMLAPSPFSITAGFIATPLITPVGLLRSSVLYDHAEVRALVLQESDPSAKGPVIDIEEVSVKAALNKPQVAFAKDLIDVALAEGTATDAELRALLACLMPTTTYNPYNQNWDGRLLTEQFKSLAHFIWSQERGFTTRDVFDLIWRDIMSEYAREERTVVNLIHRVLSINSGQYDIIMTRFIDLYIVGAMRFGQAISQIDLGKIIYFSYSHKYACQTVSEMGRVNTTWFEFIGPEEDRGTGWLYKWRPSQSFRQDRFRVQDRLRAQFLAIAERYQNISKRNAASDPGSANKKTVWVRSLNSEVWVDSSKLDERLTPPECDVFIKILGHAASVIGDATSTDRIFTQASDMMMRNHFFGRLNSEKRYLGTPDGVLQLAAKRARDDKPTAPLMIRGYHTIPINMSTAACLVDPQTEEVRRIGTIWREFFYERGEYALDHEGRTTNVDIADWTIMYLSQMLDAEMKAAIFLIWSATGRCAKTFFSEGLAETLSMVDGEENSGVYPTGYATKINNMLMTAGGRQRDGNDHSTALIKLEGKRFGLMSEGGKAGGKLDSQRIKMVHSQEMLSGRKLRKDERNFAIEMVTLMVTNLPIELDSYDTGIRRRLRIYKPKYLYMDDPDPSKPFERRLDPSYNKDLRKRQSTRNALFTLLVAAHTRLQNEFGGDFERVPVPPVVRRETLDMLTRYDNVYRFACRSLIVKSIGSMAAPDESYSGQDAAATAPVSSPKTLSYRISMSQMKEAYLNWYQKHMPPDQQRGVQSAALDEELSSGVLDRFVVIESGFKTFDGLRLVTDSLPRQAEEMAFGDYNVL